MQIRKRAVMEFPEDFLEPLLKDIVTSGHYKSYLAPRHEVF